MLALLSLSLSLSLSMYYSLSRYFLVSFDDDVVCTGRLHTHRTLLFMPVSTYVRSSQHVRAERVIYRVSQSNSATLKFSLFFSSGCFLVVLVRMEARVSRQIDLPPGNGLAVLYQQTRMYVLRSCYEDRRYIHVKYVRGARGQPLARILLRNERNEGC